MKMKDLVLVLELSTVAMDSLRVVTGERYTGEQHGVRESFCLFPSEESCDAEQVMCLGVLSFSASEATCSYDWAEEETPPV